MKIKNITPNIIQLKFYQEKTDNPAGAKKIADIFKNTIQPYLRENFLSKEEAYGTENRA